MATRSRIAIVKENGNVESVYCHWDGYPEGVGKTLVEYFNTKEKIEKLIALGSISALHETIEPKTDKHSFDTPEEGCTIAYHRDRGEDLEITKHAALSSWQYKPRRQEWNYIFIDGVWMCQGDTHKNLVPVTDYLQ